MVVPESSGCRVGGDSSAVAAAFLLPGLPPSPGAGAVPPSWPCPEGGPPDCHP